MNKTLTLIAVLLYVFVLSTTHAQAALLDWAKQNGDNTHPLINQDSSWSWNKMAKGLDLSKTDKPENTPIPTPTKPKVVATSKIPKATINTSQKPILVLQGEASFYSQDDCLGCNAQRIMANGQVLNDNALTMAIGADKKNLVGRVAKVTNLETGKSIVVTITDTGGFYLQRYGYRVADLTIATKQAIAMYGGLAQVIVEIF